MSKYPLTVGVQSKALRVVLYGPEGIGKTTLAAEFPSPIFIDIEDGSNQLPVARMPRPTSWAMLMDEIHAVRDGDVPGCSTLVIDTADAAEQLCVDAVCAEQSIKSIESPGYGKGYTYLAEKYGKLLDALGEVVDTGRNVVVVSHALCRKFERPDEEGAYDRYELKLSRKVAPMVKEWCDMLLFLDYKTIVETQSTKDGTVTKAKAKGGRRIIHTTHHPCWDAKNRFGLKDPLNLGYEELAPYIPDLLQQQRTIEHEPVVAPEPEPVQPRKTSKVASKVEAPAPAPVASSDPRDAYPDYCKQLVDLMKSSDISDEDLRKAVGIKAFFPQECPVAEYPADFVSWLVSVWDSFVPFVNEQIKDIPF
jgi:hypothetical protein